MDAGECLNYIGEKMLHAMYAWGIGKAGQRRMRKKLGSWIGTTGIDIGRRKKCITRNIACWKLNVRCVSVELENLIGQDMWGVRSICWGAVVEKLMGCGGWGRMIRRVEQGQCLLLYIHVYYIQYMHMIVRTINIDLWIWHEVCFQPNLYHKVGQCLQCLQNVLCQVGWYKMVSYKR